MIQIEEPIKTRIARAKQILTPNHRPAEVIFVQGEGVHLIDKDTRKYLDFAAGIAVNALGYNHPALTSAIADQARTLLHVSNLFVNEPQLALAEKLIDISFGDKVFFCNSGAEANEAALKLARRYMQKVRGENRYKFICTQGSFHGRSFGALSATGNPNYHDGFEPLVPGFVHVPFDDLEAVANAIDEETCAVFVEPVQGEGGLRVPADGYLAGLRRICDEAGVLLILDEVQSGIGRTGKWFGYQHEAGVAPDIMSMAKGLGGGVPIGGILCNNTVAEGFQPGTHMTTFGGNPLACRAALTVLTVIEQEGLLDHVARMGDYMLESLNALAERHEIAYGARGRGLWAGLLVDAERVDRPTFRTKALEKGLIVTQAGKDAIRLSPPLIVGRAHIDAAVEIMDDVLKEMA